MQNHRLTARTHARHSHQQLCALQRQVCTTTQRETKRLPGVETEEKTAEFALTFQDDDWGAKIKAYRKKHGLTKEELAAEIGVKQFHPSV